MDMEKALNQDREFTASVIKQLPMSEISSILKQHYIENPKALRKRLVEALQEIRDSGSQPASVHIGTGLSASYVLDAFEGAGIFIDESAMHVLQHFLFKHKERASKKGLLYRSVQDLGYQTYTSRTC